MRALPLLILLLTLLMACARGGSEEPPRAAQPAPVAITAPEGAMSKHVDVNWQITRNAAGDALDVSYTLENRGDAPVMVLDQMLVFGETEGYARDEAAIIAAVDPRDPGLLRLVRGRVAPYGRAMIELVPGGRTLAPGASLSGAARVPLPLQSWHPNDGARPLAVPPTRAVLEIGLVPADAETDDWPTPSGPVKVPGPPIPQTAQELARGAERPLP